MGTPEFAVPVLSALMDAGHDIVAVYSRPDRPTGRGKQVAATQVKRFAEDHGLRVYQPGSLKPPRVQDELASLSPDVIAVAAYGLFLPSGTLPTIQATSWPWPRRARPMGTVRGRRRL